MPPSPTAARLATLVRDRVATGDDLVDLVARLKAHPRTLVARLADAGVLDVVPHAPQPHDPPAARRANLVWLALLAATVDRDDGRLALLADECGLDPNDRNFRRWCDSRGLTGRTRPRDHYGDRAWCAVQIARGRTRSGIARAAGSTHLPAVVAAIEAHGLPLPPPAGRGARRPAQLDDRRWLAAAVAARPVAHIARELGVSHSTVTRALDRLHIDRPVPAPPPGKEPEYPQLHDRAWLSARAAAGATRAEVADELGCAESTVTKVAADLDVDLPTGRTPGRTRRFPELANATLLRAELARRADALATTGRTDLGAAVDQLAGDIGCAPDTLRSACRDLGVALPVTRHVDTHHRLTTRAWLDEHTHLTPRQVADTLGCPVGQVYAAARRFAVELADGRSAGRRNPVLADRDALAAVIAATADADNPRAASARRAGCHPSTLRKACRAFGLPLPPTRSRGPRRRFPRLHDRHWLTGRVADGDGPADIAETLGCSESAVRKALEAQQVTGWRTRASYPQLDDAELVRTHVTTGGVAALAAAVGCSYPTAWRAARAHAADLLDRQVDEDAIVADFRDHGNQSRVARDHGLSPSTVARVLTQRGELELDPDRVAHPKLADREWLAAHVAAGRTAATIGAELGVPAGSVRTAMSRYGLRSLRKGGQPRHEQLADRNWLAAAVATRTVAQIAGEVGCSTSAVYAALRRHHLAGPSGARHPGGAEPDAQPEAA